jgi:hypothetical protein
VDVLVGISSKLISDKIIFLLDELVAMCPVAHVLLFPGVVPMFSTTFPFLVRGAHSGR